MVFFNFFVVIGATQRFSKIWKNWNKTRESKQVRKLLFFQNPPIIVKIYIIKGLFRFKISLLFIQVYFIALKQIFYADLIIIIIFGKNIVVNQYISICPLVLLGLRGQQLE